MSDALTPQERMEALRERIADLRDFYPFVAAYAGGDLRLARQALKDNDIEEFHNYIRSGHERLDWVQARREAAP